MTGPRTTKPLMLVFPMLWGISFIAGKIAVRDFTPEVTSFLRFLIASVALSPFAFRKPSAPGAFAPRRLLVLFLLGFTGIFAYHVLFYYSLRYTSAGNSSLIISTDSLMTVVLAVGFLKERMTWRKGSGIVLGFLGVVWIVSDGALARLVRDGPNRGDALAFGAALAWAIYSVLSRPVSRHYSPLDLSWITWAVGAVLLSPSLLEKGAVRSLREASLLGWASVAYMAVLATGVGYFLYLKGIKELGASATAKFIFLVPVYVLLLAKVCLGEPAPPSKLAAAAVIIVGLWVAQERSNPVGEAG